jgi:hypothetical protein
LNVVADSSEIGNLVEHAEIYLHFGDGTDFPGIGLCQTECVRRYGRHIRGG